MKTPIKKLSENSAAKILERPAVIRLFGAALFIAPMINAAIVILTKKVQVNQPLTFMVIAKMYAAGTWSQISLTLASFLIGILMLFGSSKAWKFVMILLGCHIVIQIAHLGHDLRENWLWGPFFLVNVSIFFFIADQLVFKLKTPANEKLSTSVPVTAKPQTQVEANSQKFATSTQPTPVAKSEIKVRTRILVHFDHMGAWAQLKTLSHNSLVVECLTVAPANVETRELELLFQNGLHLKSRFKNKENRDYFFEFNLTDPVEKKLLSEWMRKQIA